MPRRVEPCRTGRAEPTQRLWLTTDEPPGVRRGRRHNRVLKIKNESVKRAPAHFGQENVAQQHVAHRIALQLVREPPDDRDPWRRLSGNVGPPDGTVVARPEPAAWKGLHKPNQQDRRWNLAPSLGEISRGLKNASYSIQSS